jgi:hypothetical protein
MNFDQFIGVTRWVEGNTDFNQYINKDTIRRFYKNKDNIIIVCENVHNTEKLGSYIVDRRYSHMFKDFKLTDNSPKSELKPAT